MYDVPGRVNNLYKDPQVPYILEPEPDVVEQGYPPQCEFTRASGRGTVDYCNTLGPPQPLASQPKTPWISGFICVLALLLILRS